MPLLLESVIQLNEMLHCRSSGKLAGEMLDDAPVKTGPSPPNLISKQLSFLPGIFADLAPIGSICVKD